MSLLRNSFDWTSLMGNGGGQFGLGSPDMMSLLAEKLGATVKPRSFDLGGFGPVAQSTPQEVTSFGSPSQAVTEAPQKLGWFDRLAGGSPDLGMPSVDGDAKKVALKEALMAAGAALLQAKAGSYGTALGEAMDKGMGSYKQSLALHDKIGQEMKDREWQSKERAQTEGSWATKNESDKLTLEEQKRQARDRTENDARMESAEAAMAEEVSKGPSGFWVDKDVLESGGDYWNRYKAAVKAKDFKTAVEIKNEAIQESSVSEKSKRAAQLKSEELAATWGQREKELNAAGEIQKGVAAAGAFYRGGDPNAPGGKTFTWASREYNTMNKAYQNAREQFLANWAKDFRSLDKPATEEQIRQGALAILGDSFDVEKFAGLQEILSKGTSGGGAQGGVGNTDPKPEMKESDLQVAARLAVESKMSEKEFMTRAPKELGITPGRALILYQEAKKGTKVATPAPQPTPPPVVRPIPISAVPTPIPSPPGKPLTPEEVMAIAASSGGGNYINPRDWPKNPKSKPLNLTLGPELDMYKKLADILGWSS